MYSVPPQMAALFWMRTPFWKAVMRAWEIRRPSFVKRGAVKTALGLRADDEIVGFLYVGTDVGGEGTIPRPEAKNYVSVWAG